MSENKAYPAQYDSTISVKNLTRAEFGEKVAKFIFEFIDYTINNRQIVLLVSNHNLAPKGVMKNFYLTKGKGNLKNHIIYFDAAETACDLSYQIKLTGIARSLPGDMYSREWKVLLQREAILPLPRQVGKKVKPLVGIERKEYMFDENEFNISLIKTLVEKEEDYIRLSTIKRILKDMRRYEDEKSSSNYLNVWISINRVFGLQVKTLNKEYIPLRFSEVSKRNKKINYTKVYNEYKLENIPN